MRATAQYDLNATELKPAQKRLLDEHAALHSWHRVAKKYKINIRYVYGLGVHGIIPHNQVIRRKLRIRKTINEHMAEDTIQDMPAPLLAYAIEHRQELRT